MPLLPRVATVATTTTLLAAALAASASHAADTAAVVAPTLQAGDTWVYDDARETGATGFSSQRLELAVDRVDAETMLVGIRPAGAQRAFEDHICGLDWSQRRIIAGRESVTSRPFRYPMKVGDTWTADYIDPTPHGVTQSTHFHTVYEVMGWEDVEVPAGKFHVLKIEAHTEGEAKVTIPAAAVGGAVASPTGQTAFVHTQRGQSGTSHFLNYEALYYAPEVKYNVKTVFEAYNNENVRVTRTTRTLMSFKPAAPQPN